MTGLPADQVAKITGMLESGAQVIVADERVVGKQKIIARGKIRDISFREEAACIYLNTGYYILVFPVDQAEPELNKERG